VINIERKSHQKNAIALNLTSLIDVLFLLVIFFLLTTKFITSDAVDLNISTVDNSKPAANSEKAIVVTLVSDGKVMLSDHEFKLDELQVRIGEVIRDNKNKDIVLVSKEGATVQNMVTAMDKIRAAGGSNISLAE
jgi:biopolymer transport protein ExbD